MKNQPWRIAAYIIVLLTSSVARVGAEEAGGALDGVTEDISAESEVRSAYMARRQELMELKASDPEAFHKRIVALRNDAQKRLDGLKESDPQTYDRVIRRRQQRIEPKFERMREESPDAYERVQNHRQGLIQKRVTWFEKNDPAKYQEIEKNRQMRAAAIPPTVRRVTEPSAKLAAEAPVPNEFTLNQRAVGPGVVRPHRANKGPKLRDWSGRPQTRYKRQNGR